MIKKTDVYILISQQNRYEKPKIPSMNQYIMSLVLTDSSYDHIASNDENQDLVMEPNACCFIKQSNVENMNKKCDYQESSNKVLLLTHVVLLL